MAVTPRLPVADGPWQTALNAIPLPPGHTHALIVDATYRDQAVTLAVAVKAGEHWTFAAGASLDGSQGFTLTAAEVKVIATW